MKLFTFARNGAETCNSNSMSALAIQLSDINYFSLYTVVTWITLQAPLFIN